LGATFIFNLMFWEIHKINLWHKAFNTTLVTFQKDKFSRKLLFCTHLCLFEWKTSFRFFCEIIWVELVMWSWNSTIDTYSIFFCGSYLNHKTIQSHSNQLCHLGCFSWNSCEWIYVKVKISHLSLGFMLESFTRCWWSHGQRSWT
jgi:hypothetical protein